MRALLLPLLAALLAASATPSGAARHLDPAEAPSPLSSSSDGAAAETALLIPPPLDPFVLPEPLLPPPASPAPRCSSLPPQQCLLGKPMLGEPCDSSSAWLMTGGVGGNGNVSEPCCNSFCNATSVARWLLRRGAGQSVQSVAQLSPFDVLTAPGVLGPRSAVRPSHRGHLRVLQAGGRPVPGGLRLLLGRLQRAGGGGGKHDELWLRG